MRDFDGRAFTLVPESKTLGILYGHGFRTAAHVFRTRVSAMHLTMHQYKYVWRSNRFTKDTQDKSNKIDALVWNKGLYWFPLSPVLIRMIRTSPSGKNRHMNKY